MKFNPYAALLMTGALMLITVVLFQTGSTSAALLRAGAVSVDKDVSSFAAKTWTSLEKRTSDTQQHAADQPRERPTRVASIDRQPQENPTAD